MVDNDTDRNDKDEMPYGNDKDEMPYDSDNNQMPYKYDNDNDTAITEVKNDRNMTNNDLKYVGTKDVVPYIRDDSMMTKVKRPVETSDIDRIQCANQWKIGRLMTTTKLGDIYKVP